MRERYHDMLQSLLQLHWLIFAVTLGFASVVEWSHFRRFQRQGNIPRMAFTGIAAIAAGFMASEALDRDWPTWRGYGYDD